MIRGVISKYNSLSLQVKATFWFLICSVLQRGISVITTPIFTRLLTTYEYGQYSVFTSWLSIIQIIVTLQLTAGVYTMGIVKFKEKESIFTSSMQGLNLVLCLAWTIVYFLSRDFWNSVLSLTTVQMLALLIIIWTTSTFTFWMTTQRNLFRYKKLVVITLIVSILKPVIGIIFVTYSEDKVTARILGLALVEVICYSGFFFSQMYKGKVFYSKKYWKYAILFNLPLIPHYLSSTILASSDKIMIQKMVDDSAAGIYSLAYSISLVMNMVKDSINKTLSPYIYQRIREKDYKNISELVYSSLVIICIANALLIAVAPEIVDFFAPNEYKDAIYVIPPIAMSVNVQFLYFCFVPFEFYYEKRLWTTIGTLTNACLNMVLNYIFIQFYGYQAAGYTTLVCYTINSLMHYYFMRKVCKIYLNDLKPYSAKILIGITLGFCALGFIYIPMYSLPIVRYVFTAVLLVVIFIRRRRLMPVLKKMLKM